VPAGPSQGNLPRLRLRARAEHRRYPGRRRLGPPDFARAALAPLSTVPCRQAAFRRTRFSQREAVRSQPRGRRTHGLAWILPRRSSDASDGSPGRSRRAASVRSWFRFAAGARRSTRERPIRARPWRLELGSWWSSIILRERFSSATPDIEAPGCSGWRMVGSSFRIPIRGSPERVRRVPTGPIRANPVAPTTVGFSRLRSRMLRHFEEAVV